MVGGAGGPGSDRGTGMRPEDSGAVDKSLFDVALSLSLSPLQLARNPSTELTL